MEKCLNLRFPNVSHIVHEHIFKSRKSCVDKKKCMGSFDCADTFDKQKLTKRTGAI